MVEVVVVVIVKGSRVGSNSKQGTTGVIIISQG